MVSKQREKVYYVRWPLHGVILTLESFTSSVEHAILQAVEISGGGPLPSIDEVSPTGRVLGRYSTWRDQYSTQISRLRYNNLAVRK